METTADRRCYRLPPPPPPHSTLPLNSNDDGEDGPEWVQATGTPASPSSPEEEAIASMAVHRPRRRRKSTRASWRWRRQRRVREQPELLRKDHVNRREARRLLGRRDLRNASLPNLYSAIRRTSTPLTGVMENTPKKQTTINLL